MRALAYVRTRVCNFLCKLHEEIFESTDKDGSGKVSQEEFVEIAQDPEVRLPFSASASRFARIVPGVTGPWDALHHG